MVANSSTSSNNQRTMPKQRCGATRKDGEPCLAAGTVDGFCPTHAPSMRAKMADARRRGGQNRSNQIRVGRMVPADLRPIYDLLRDGLWDVRDGRLEPRSAAAMASLAGAVIKILAAGEMEQRLRAIEDAVNKEKANL